MTGKLRIIPINEAEAIIEAFWDEKLSELEEYRVTTRGRCYVKQTWCSAEIQIDGAKVEDIAVRMERHCNIILDDYDVFRVFASVPKWVRIAITVRIDGKEQTVINTVGTDTFNEFNGEIHGRCMTGICMKFSLTEARPARIEILWLGLVKRMEEKKMEERRSPYVADWPKLLEKKPGELKPEIGIFFNEDDLISLRRKIQSGYLKNIFDKMRQGALACMKIVPEEEEGTFVPWPDRRWCRDRDMKRISLAGKMELLAFVGLIEENLEMCRMAARMALSAACCNYWCESFIGVFPCSTWHHRSFTEEAYCRACALVLDWAGSCLTPYGKEVIRDAIIMKGLPRIESDFKRMEYIRKMNQGILFSFGRIIALLALVPEYPRYRNLLEEAERDLHEIINSYIQADGGTLEGMAYWNASFSAAIPTLYALARYKNKTFKEYVSSNIIKTGDYALSMLSIVGDGATYLPINDAHSGKTFTPSLVAAYCQISDREEWKSLYNVIIQMIESGQLEPDVFLPIFAPSEISTTGSIIRSKFIAFPDTGQVCSIRKDPSLGHVHFHFCSGLNYPGHFHEDKGSFILEVGDDVLAMDRGITSYDHPDQALIPAARYHNLLYPEEPNEGLLHQPPNAAGKIGSAIEREGIVMIAGDNTNAWPHELFKMNIRRIFSPTPDLFLVDDEVEMYEPFAVSFLLNSLLPIRRIGDEFWIYGKKSLLRVVPVNWVPDRVIVGADGIDDHLRQVNVLRMTTKEANSHRLLTALQVMSTDVASSKLWRFRHEAYGATGIRDPYEIHFMLKNSLIAVTMKVLEKEKLTAKCHATGWEIGN